MDKIFFEIDPKYQDNKTVYVARIQVNDLLKEVKESDADLSQKVEHLERLYRNTIIFCRGGLGKIKKVSSGERILLYWDVANRIWQYLEVSESNGFFLNNYYKHFIRDLNVSRETVKRLLRLRKSVKAKSNLDTTKSWVYYTLEFQS